VKQPQLATPPRVPAALWWLRIPWRPANSPKETAVGCVAALCPSTLAGGRPRGAHQHQRTARTKSARLRVAALGPPRSRSATGQLPIGNGVMTAGEAPVPLAAASARVARVAAGAARVVHARRVSTVWAGLIVSASTPIPWHCGSHPMANDQICTAVADWVRGPRCAVTHLPGAPVWGRNAPTGAAARPFVGCAVLRCTAVAVTPNVADFCGPLCGLVQRPPVSGRRHSRHRSGRQHSISPSPIMGR